jgi:hypothetical protein
VLSTNRKMLGVFQRSGLRVRSKLDSGVYDVEMFFEPKGASP